MMDKEHQYSNDELDDEQYVEERKEILKRNLSNTMLFDKAILTLSSAGLGFSLAFIRKGVLLGESTQLHLTSIPWWLFSIAIASTLISFITSNHGLAKQLRSYENNSDNPKNPNRITTFLRCVSLVCYLLAIFFVILFAMLSLNTNHISKEVLL